VFRSVGGTPNYGTRQLATIKGLFGKPDQTSVELEESFTHDIPQVSGVENEILTLTFAMEEVRKTVFQMEHNKAPGSDEFPIEFYQVF
jgi:hypothetical protein